MLHRLVVLQGLDEGKAFLISCLGFLVFFLAKISSIRLAVVKWPFTFLSFGFREKIITGLFGG
jgi:hypothetical protein